MSEIFIYDEIGPDYWGFVSSKTVMNELEKIGKGKPVTVRINSPGGDVVEAQAIYNALRRHSDGGGVVTIEIDALAASAASFIAMAGDTINIAENAMMMIHRASTIAFGNAQNMRETADVLDKFDGILTDTYTTRSGTAKDEVVKLLAAETWLTAQESVDKGFADAIGQPLNSAKARVRPGMFAKTPDWLVSGEPSPAAVKRQQQAAAKVEQVRQQIRVARAKIGV